MKKILVCGAGGFIGHNLVKRLKSQGHYVIGADLKHPQFEQTHADMFLIGDLTNAHFCKTVFSQMRFSEVYQLAADMGGAEYIFSKANDANIMRNSAMINLNILDHCIAFDTGKIFYSSSACIYPEHNQMDADNPNCEEDSAYPANPDSEYGWEKLYSERLYLDFAKQFGLEVRIARFHNIYGENGTYEGGKQKAPADIIRQCVKSVDGTSIYLNGDGKQTRSFLYIDECLNGIQRLMESDVSEPLNIGSDEMVTINQLAKMTIEISGKNLGIVYKDGFQGVRGRCSDNDKIQRLLNWQPNYPLRVGLEKTYDWIKSQIEKNESVL